MADTRIGPAFFLLAIFRHFLTKKEGNFWDYFSKCKFDYFFHFKKKCQYFDLKKYEKNFFLASNQSSIRGLIQIWLEVKEKSRTFFKPCNILTSRIQDPMV
jgi:hypothetical protein